MINVVSPAVGGDLLPGYELGEIIADTAQTRVVRARRADGTRVVIKISRPGISGWSASPGGSARKPPVGKPGSAFAHAASKISSVIRSGSLEITSALAFLEQAREDLNGQMEREAAWNQEILQLYLD
jgi:hypothetical protein